MNSPALSIAALAAVGAFVLVTGLQLPPVVASHFDGSGAADGYMTRTGYLVFMLVLMTAVPGGMMLMRGILSRFPARYVNMPNRAHWLAPERRDASIEYLGRHLTRLGWAMLALFAFLHWRIVEANRLEPPHLAAAWVAPALVTFALAAGFWLWALYRRFPPPP